MIQIIKKPLVTEKNTLLADKNVYVFEVDKKADKTSIKKAVQEAFDVKVISVQTQVCRGKSKRTAHGIIARKIWKKATVRLAKGESIKIFEGAE